MTKKYEHIFPNSSFQFYVIFYGRILLGKVYCFNVPPDAKIRQKAKEEDVELKDFNVIYKLVDDLKEELSARVTPVEEFEVTGTMKKR